jgi:hypothetical protein
MSTIALGKIAYSESHLLYYVRIYDISECAEPPKPEHYAFGRFVSVKTSAEHPVMGVIVNSRLINPIGGHYGPRLTIPHEQNAVFAPDYLNETGVEIAVLLIGYLRESVGKQGIPTQVMGVGDEVRTLDQRELLDFHRSADGKFQMHYYPLIMESRVPFASALLLQICSQLEVLCEPKEKRILAVMRKNIIWQSTIGLTKQT